MTGVWPRTSCSHASTNTWEFRLATQAQYHAAIVAMSKLAHAKISALPFFEQGMAARAMSPDLIEEFAKVAVDAAIAMPVVLSQSAATLPKVAEK